MFRHGRLTCYHCGKPGHAKRQCMIKIREKGEKWANNNQHNKNNEETTDITLYGEVLIIVSCEDAHLYTYRHDSIWF